MVGYFMSTVIKAEQFLKASVSTRVMLLGSITDTSPVQFMKARGLWQ